MTLCAACVKCRSVGSSEDISQSQADSSAEPSPDVARWLHTIAAVEDVSGRLHPSKTAESTPHKQAAINQRLAVLAQTDPNGPGPSGKAHVAYAELLKESLDTPRALSFSSLCSHKSNTLSEDSSSSEQYLSHHAQSVKLLSRGLKSRH